MGFALPPSLLNALKYTGDQIAAIPGVNNPRAPTTTDRNYPLFTLWRYSSTVPDGNGNAEGDMWYLAKFIPNGTSPALADWVKMQNASIPEFVQFVGGTGTSGTFPVQPDGSGNITLQSSDSSVQIIGGASSLDYKVGGSVAITYQANSGSSTASANIEQIKGNNTGDNGFATWTTGSSNLHTIKSYGAYKWVVNPVAGVGTHTTINSAIASASPGDSIFITPGTYTENINAPYSINLIGPDVAQFSQGVPNVTIKGKISNSANGAIVSVTNLRLETNGDYVLQLSGANASQLFVRDCYLSAVDFSLTSSSNSSTSSNLRLQNCVGNLLTAGVNIFNHSSGNTLRIFDCIFLNGASSTTPNTSSSVLVIDNVYFGTPTLTGIATTLTAGNAAITNCYMQPSGGPIIISGGSHIIDTSTVGTITMSNAATLTVDSSSTDAIALSNTSSLVIYNSTIAATAGASAITVNAGTSAVATNCVMNSAAINAITGAGSVTYTGINFSSSSTINATTQIPGVSSNDCVKVTTPGAYPYTAVPQDAVILVDTSSARTINLNASPRTGQRYRIKDNVGSAGANNITITPAAGNIDGAASATINTNWGSVDVVYNGTQWNIL